MIALVVELIAASSLSMLMLQVSGSTSTKTGRAPTRQMTSAVATKVKGVVMTSSPGPTPKAIKLIRSASVPEATLMQCAAPV